MKTNEEYRLIEQKLAESLARQAEIAEKAGEVMRRRIMLDRGTMTMHEWYWHKNRICKIPAVTLEDLK